MQTWTRDGVRQERTGWRDQELSARHRVWGFNCPAVDLDFLMVEYNLGLPVAVVEYKHNRARIPETLHPTYRALTALCDGYKDGPLPFFMAFYWPECWAFRIHPLNAEAKARFQDREELSELEYVARLYTLRQLTIAEQVLLRLNRSKPPTAK